MIRRKVVQKEPAKLGIVQSCQYTNVGSHRQLEAWKKDRYNVMIILRIGIMIPMILF